MALIECAQRHPLRRRLTEWRVQIGSNLRRTLLSNSSQRLVPHTPTTTRSNVRHSSRMILIKIVCSTMRCESLLHIYLYMCVHKWAAISRRRWPKLHAFRAQTTHCECECGGICAPHPPCTNGRTVQRLPSSKRNIIDSVWHASRRTERDACARSCWRWNETRNTVVYTR